MATQSRVRWLCVLAAHRSGLSDTTDTERHFVMSRNSLNSTRAVPKDHLMWRVVDYVNANPSEVLTRNDIATKFDAAPSTVDSALTFAVAASMLKREDGTEDGTVWRHPGAKTSFPRPFTPSLGAATRAERRTRAAARRVDFDAIEIESGIPVLESRAGCGGQWTALFDRMKPGDSFQLPTRTAGAASHAKLKYCRQVEGAKFVLRKVSSTHTRVWRTA